MGFFIYFILYLKYTKSTDSAISIGEETEYSTSEKIVGSWIDGKPIYQKTINFGSLPNASDKSVAHGISSIGYVVDIKGTAKSGSSYSLINDVNTTTNIINRVYVDATNVTIQTKNDRTAWTAYITIQYTKA